MATVEQRRKDNPLFQAPQPHFGGKRRFLYVGRNGKKVYSDTPYDPANDPYG